MPTGLTLLEAAKYMDDPVRVGVIQKLAGGNPLLEIMPFIDITTLTYPYNVEAELPTIAFRGINDTTSYAGSVGIILPENETLKPMGNTNETDRVLVKTTPGYRARQDAMFIKAVGRNYALKFFQGDTSSDRKEFDGLNRRLTGSQLKSAGVTDDGISMNSDAGVAALDAGIDAVAQGDAENTKIFMSLFIRRELTTYARSNTNHQLEWAMNDAGKRVPMWAGMEIRVTDGDDDASQTPLISITEDDSAAANQSTTSVYVVRFDADGEYTAGLQHSDGIEVEDKGSIQNAETETTLVEWLASVYTPQPRSAARIRHYKTTL